MDVVVVVAAAVALASFLASFVVVVGVVTVDHQSYTPDFDSGT